MRRDGGTACCILFLLLELKALHLPLRTPICSSAFQYAAQRPCFCGILSCFGRSTRWPHGIAQSLFFVVLARMVLNRMVLVCHRPTDTMSSWTPLPAPPGRTTLQAARAARPLRPPRARTRCGAAALLQGRPAHCLGHVTLYVYEHEACCSCYLRCCPVICMPALSGAGH